MDEPTTHAPDYTAQKRQFAALLLKYPHKAQDHAFTVFPHQADSMMAVRAGQDWPADPDVRQFMAELVAAKGAEASLTNREETALEILELARQATGPRDKVEVYRLYGQYRGFLGGTSQQSDDDVASALGQLYSKIQGTTRPKPKGAR